MKYNDEGLIKAVMAKANVIINLIEGSMRSETVAFNGCLELAAATKDLRAYCYGASQILSLRALLRHFAYRRPQKGYKDHCRALLRHFACLKKDIKITVIDSIMGLWNVLSPVGVILGTIEVNLLI
ncbi:uncharacterized protein LOC110006766 [Amborella trichopoda]|uniref:uncharacterized protein LOC110006766 n=1 Tax=Amborella trichopoda TaxID=13333 RepID=UPI0009BCAF0B|nr:uncharacterized protein LOC110006766 [Amborella trichopoda]|eukprot:XP_020519501.1 uncharacterized protein LOC110006766 [Amborella trichopoda]